MVRASDVDVTIAIDRVPLLDGARETVALGIFSSLQPQNVRLRRAIREPETVAMHPVYPLLFDRRRLASASRTSAISWRRTFTFAPPLKGSPTPSQPRRMD